MVLTGAGVSAESGVPTFRGAGGFWREFQAQDLASPEAFQHDPSVNIGFVQKKLHTNGKIFFQLVWEFYHYRREVMLEKKPNPAHFAIADLEKRFKHEGKKVVVITQNIDELHRRAGTENLLELHGSLFRTLCTSCGKVENNYDSPICQALKGTGRPDPKTRSAKITKEDLPTCPECRGLLRPAVIWFGERLDSDVLEKAEEELENCDLCLVIGTSSVVYPAAMFAPQVFKFM